MSSPEYDAFTALVDGASPRLLRTAYLLTGDWGRAEDLLQTALAKTWLRWGSLRDAGAAEAYVRRILVTTAGKSWRRRWHGEVPTDALPVHAGNDHFALVDDRDALRRSLATLTQRQRSVVVLRYYEDLSEAEVADLLGCSVGTIKSTASRALAGLRLDHLASRDDARAPLRAAPAWERQT
ncbi:MAG TPA: SigE family RNA polymerase sigma factor [Mycobacteriales bacterium]|nr:SigE family RNA polymerase sigma factor [Mycobacteriales bacterium]